MSPDRIATQQNTVSAAPGLRPGATTCARLRLDANDGPLVEGGLRLKGLYKASMAGRPLVSIVTVCRNAAATLENAMLSVFQQSWDNLEYIVVDGASSDQTPALLARHADAIDYFVSEPDASLYEAMNKGLSLATGDFVLLLNADDSYVPTAVEELLQARRCAGTSFVSALAAEITPQGVSKSIMRSMPYDSGTRLRMPLRHETMLIPAAVYDAVGGYDQSYRIAADFELTMRLYDAGYTHYEIPRPLLNFRNDGISNVDDAGMLRERARVIAGRFSCLSAEDVNLLCDRRHHTGQQLLALASRHADQPDLVRSVHEYVEDNVLHVRSKDRPWWRDGQAELLDELKRHRSALRPKVSVILAVYNAQQTLRLCLDSVLRQTLTEFELICINDQTPDESQAIIDEYAARDSRVVSMTNPVNVGLGATRNRGVRRARGAYIFHLDPDDTLPDNALQLLYDHAQQHGSDLVRGAYRREQFHNARADAAGSVVMHPMKTPQTIVNVGVAALPELLKMPEGHWAFLYKAELARRVPYPEDLKMGQDGIFLCCVLPAARTITIVPDVVYNYLANAESAMNVFNMRKYLDVLEWRRRALHVLTDHGLREFGVRLVTNFAALGWHDQFRRHYAQSPDRASLDQLGKAMRQAFSEAGLDEIPPRVPPEKRGFLQHLLAGRIDDAERELLRAPAPAGASAAKAAKADSTPAPASVPAAGTRPQVSVILPFFRAESTISAALDSVLAQSLREFEVVCVDDQAPDGSAAIVRAYAARDPRVVLLPNDRNIGHGASRNAGVKAARGEFVFHLDPDDMMPPTALERLVAAARRHGSDMVRGAYLHEQALMGQKAAKPVRKGLSEGAPPVVNTNLAARPQLLDHTEGHWSYLYRTEFARRVPYPTDLKMGQDSIFIVHALIAARSVTLTGELAYIYRANQSSAMNSFTHRKFLDSVEWRRRAWRALDAAGHQAIGRRLLLAYWSEPFFAALRRIEGPAQLQEFANRVAAAFVEAGLSHTDLDRDRPPQRALFDLLARRSVATIALPASAPAAARPDGKAGVRVLTLISRDHGGAGTGTMRRVEALRKRGADARVGTLVKRSAKPFVSTLSPQGGAPSNDPEAVWRMVRERAIDPVRAVPGYCAQELFSLPESVLDFRRLRGQIDAADVLHLHWVVGMFDYAHAAEVLGDRPVVWTLADMNPFTGGCHYSEGCEEYQRECRACPLLGGQSDMAQRALERKKASYAGLRNLHIICPSQWIADRVAKSALLGDRPIHVIPNAFPTDRFTPTNKVVARIELGLPLDKKLLLFGADSLTSKRKGSDWLKRALRMVANRDIEVVLFGGGKIDLPLPAHRLGHIEDEERLALAYSAADAFLFPSAEDNAPLTIGEALLCGTPVVAFPVGNVPDLVRHLDTGYIARYQDAADLVRGIEWVLAADATSALRRSLRCRQSAAAFHDPVVAADRHLEVYQEAMRHA
ncbi:MAG TPA: glycosyltransferase [Ideonella sp.]|uniref:glycosyltransferase n=1 Tax=Ideonella sp. TaxID=1929293 RepID=UPI002E314030|nr:glycosyltransferase [Ideonella sp.]HEX5686726.1 glycosyltransferase [Ideonella sp.]